MRYASLLIGMVGLGLIAVRIGQCTTAAIGCGVALACLLWVVALWASVETCKHLERENELLREAGQRSETGGDQTAS